MRDAPDARVFVRLRPGGLDGGVARDAVGNRAAEAAVLVGSDAVLGRDVLQADEGAKGREHDGVDDERGRNQRRLMPRERNAAYGCDDRGPEVVAERVEEAVRRGSPALDRRHDGTSKRVGVPFRLEAVDVLERVRRDLGVHARVGVAVEEVRRARDDVREDARAHQCENRPEDLIEVARLVARRRRVDEPAPDHGIEDVRRRRQPHAAERAENHPRLLAEVALEEYHHFRKFRRVAFFVRLGHGEALFLHCKKYHITYKICNIIAGQRRYSISMPRWPSSCLPAVVTSTLQRQRNPSELHS